MAEWLRWYVPSESAYRQEAIEQVRQRARRLLPIFLPLAQPVPVSALEAKATIRLVRQEIANPLARDVIAQELLGLVGRKFTRRELTLLACRISGGLYMAGQGFSPAVLASEGAPAECLGVVHEVSSAGEFQGDQLIALRFVVSNGPYCAEKLELQFRLTKIKSWGRLFGLVHPRQGLLAKTPLVFLDARAVMRLERDQSGVTCLGVTVPKSVEGYNRKLAKLRKRKHYPCPYGATHDCDRCGVGRNQCERSLSVISTQIPLTGETHETT